jgi:hypothetical protein
VRNSYGTSAMRQSIGMNSRTSEDARWLDSAGNVTYGAGPLCCIVQLRVEA